ncbi:hypothetical protein M9H77_25835 [Catharanthus roseus]|uniref:Uncharacterized protein n=1 Tax=Catharanthus roseus TaxID=4058 RepID=A0ACC0A804_CATRO|nr:hypothetical protein M9H77_25835 [Catharanthus roseus]
MDTVSCSVVGFDCLVESKEGLETEVGPRPVWTSDMGVQLFGNRALVWCLAGIDYEMPELGSDDLVMGSELCLWSPTIALYVISNLGVEAVLMYLDSLKLPNCARTPHIGSSISDGQRYIKLLVPRGTQIPYSVAVGLVAGLGVLPVVLEL